ncbi:MAG: methyltransferase [Pseudomonadales bacterium]|jgi:predicted methyltransferase|nr:methyltransferase [Pseudomonadales bacterium]
MKLTSRSLLLAASVALAGCSGDSTPDSPPAPAPETPSSASMDAAAGALSDMADAVADAAREGATAAAVLAALSGSHRSEGNAARDVYRHPVETLTFFGITPDMTVVEVWPGGATAWYTEVLAPALSDGRLIAASYSTESEGYFGRVARAYQEKLEAAPEVYANVEVIDYQDPTAATLGSEGSADAVLLFRLYHNAINGETEDDILADAFAALKPGGVLGVVQHRSPEDAPDEKDRRDGYVKESKVIADAEAVGFVLEARSEINANARDTHEHPGGVWTLPPTLAVCGEMEDEAEKAACTAEYQAIGESDRMTLKFVKPSA